MALKDWKKTGKDTWSNKSREVYLQIEKGEGEDSYNYGVVLNSSYTVAGGSNYLKGFKTKPQALSFARSYMRSH